MNELSKYEPNLEALGRLADTIGGTGWFGLKSQAEGICKILWGREAGLGPIASLRGIDVIQGAPAPSASLINSLICAHDHYAIHVLQSTDTRAIILWFKGRRLSEASPYEAEGPERTEDDQTPVSELVRQAKPGEGLKPGVNYVGWEAYDVGRAERAGFLGKQNYRKHLQEMLFWRALTAGERLYAPNLFNGIKAYTPCELGDESPPDPVPDPVQVKHVRGRPAPSEPITVIEADLDQPSSPRKEWLF